MPGKKKASSKVFAKVTERIGNGGVQTHQYADEILLKVSHSHGGLQNTVKTLSSAFPVAFCLIWPVCFLFYKKRERGGLAMVS
jgi:hypothetical protein